MNILILSPHPDDETLGCGGAIRKHANAGDLVNVVYLTSGEKGIPGDDPEGVALRREAESHAAGSILGLHSQVYLRFPDGGLWETAGLEASIADLLRVMAPDLVYAPHGDDGHADHMAVGRIVRKLAGGKSAPVRFYEIWTPLPFPAIVEDITAVVTEKRAAIRAYASQAERNALVEGVLALNHFRGLLHGPNIMYAEAFGVV